MSRGGWIGVDLDGTLAQYRAGDGIGTVGPPVPAMMERVKRWLAEGKEVRLVTARADPDLPEQTILVHEWCAQHGLPLLAVTASKDWRMIVLYDDRAVQVEPNTGRILGVPFHDIQEAGGAASKSA